eukprot:Blabericola_migrator_1__13308@NODE_933_length_5987_cov_26_727196_g649_i0_p4_GENE_NODE_933_length_5987_cov_26_727196_g649_i0NODE_933_length_5987_cov_26_727196_g649_i0_p4_ORF_typecomplete_len101_score5_65_NODE_933_length_5987_cov_26_727196_g649_i021182420
MCLCIMKMQQSRSETNCKSDADLRRAQDTCRELPSLKRTTLASETLLYMRQYSARQRTTRQSRGEKDALSEGFRGHQQTICRNETRRVLIFVGLNSSPPR